MTAPQGHQNQQTGSGQHQDSTGERDSAHAAGSPATTEAAAGIPQQAGRVRESVEAPLAGEVNADQPDAQADETDPSEVQNPSDRIEEHPEDQNSG